MCPILKKCTLPIICFTETSQKKLKKNIIFVASLFSFGGSICTCLHVVISCIYYHIHSLQQVINNATLLMI